MSNTLTPVLSGRADSPRLAWVLKRPELGVGGLAVVAMVVIGSINPAFWDAANLFSLLRANVITGILALGVMIVMLSGGIDVSFPAFAIAAMYLTIKGMIALGYDGVVLPFAVATMIGLLLGLINGLFVYGLRMIPLIVTLGTGTAVRGLLLGAVGSSQINIDRMPPALIGFGRLEFLRSVGGGNGLSTMVVLYAALAVMVHLMLRHTLIGRSIFALGGSEEAARRAGFNVRTTIFFIYGMAGALAGCTGLLHGSMIWVANPRDMVGIELDVIAAVVLGGTSIFGGRGSVMGTMLGVFTLVLLTNSLIIMHIDTTWQRIVTGSIVILAAAATSWRDRRIAA
ncbi:ribose/xylose/arabinose/galactoside ABC transporter permease [Ameyamaea chiangmaiensis NBRC 103196]|uniref:ABC transporter permease n=1 Tax=Ameyamaea chiangmaiensis TaxID=442969 RepID=A0A850PBP7_9PROT|nr:ABC transporter permease [Ameyamaea chiangmaiensis]MBS4074139.1 ABC transporter permease [Ameyamaea chiangmaiensis]NVN39950.1 ABC transporter permease [Ameyamaea chiangmaiensis]GBQ71013.1 ribose/xylose/arabinose/galactoside ABC transporter permease [Ameyamaea chiangmaiensis NBRC 103196]